MMDYCYGGDGDVCFEQPSPREFCRAKEKCGICLSSTSTCGVLDCCDHLFCSSCIDTWSSITNRCPICKSIFKLITFRPVSGDDLHQSNSAEIEDEGSERDSMFDHLDEALPFAFPSLFIDEEAVECLQGEECLVQHGQRTFESWNDLADTSVACDSCDRWYHAICVGFDPKKAEGVWWCPRCLPEKLSWQSQNVDCNMDTKAVSFTMPSHVANCMLDAVEELNEGLPFSVSMPELGETAVVVSMVMGTTKQTVEQANSPDREEFLSSSPNHRSQQKIAIPNFDFAHLEGDTDVKTLDSNAFEEQIQHRLSIKVNFEVENSDETQDSKATFLVGPGSSHNFLALENHISAEKNNPEVQQVISPAKEFPTSSPNNLSEQKIVISNLQCAQLAGDEEAKTSENKVFEEEFRHQPSNEVSFEVMNSNEAQEPKATSLVPAEGSNKFLAPPTHISSEKEDLHNLLLETPCTSTNVQVSGEVSSSLNIPSKSNDKGKRALKRKSFNVNSSIMDVVQAGGSANKSQNTGCKKASWEGSVSTPVPVNCQGPKAKESLPNNFVLLQNPEVADNAEHDSIAISLQTIRPEDSTRLAKGSKPEASMMEVGGIATGSKVIGTDKVVRTRTIMWRMNEEKRHISPLVEEVRQMMRTAAGYGASKGLGKVDVSDEKFLSALRNALAKNSQQKKNAIDALRCRNPGLLKRTGTRESLMKKLYSGGRGKWDRDWDVSFWRDRIRRSSKDFTDENLADKEIEKIKGILSSKTKGEQSESLLGRLYVADTSLLPRGDNIKPLSEKLKHQAVDPEKCGAFKDRTRINVQSQLQNSSSTNTLYDAIPRKSDGKNQSNQKRTQIGFSHSAVQSVVSTGATKNPDFTVERPSSTERSDKRKWALDLLARKKGEKPPPLVHDRKGSSSSDKDKNFPLLACLPFDLRPVVEPNLRSQIPTSVRQAQLNRLVEHHLKRVDHFNVGRNEESRAAVAAAVIKEKSIYEKSNSRIVYTNLCVQSLNQQEDSLAVKKSEDILLNNWSTGLHSPVNAALLAAGLISPPGSPEMNADLKITEEQSCPSGDASGCHEEDNEGKCLPSSCDPCLEAYEDMTDSSSLRMGLSSAKGAALISLQSPGNGPESFVPFCTLNKDESLLQDSGLVPKQPGVSNSTINRTSGSNSDDDGVLNPRKFNLAYKPLHHEQVVSCCQDASIIPFVHENFDKDGQNLKSYNETSESLAQCGNQSVCSSTSVSVSTTILNPERDLGGMMMQNDDNRGKIVVSCTSDKVLPQVPEDRQEDSISSKSTICILSSSELEKGSDLNLEKTELEPIAVHGKPTVCRDPSVAASASGNKVQDGKRPTACEEISEELVVKCVSRNECPADAIAVADTHTGIQKDIEGGLMQNDTLVIKLIHSTSVASSIQSGCLKSQDPSALPSTCERYEEESQAFSCSDRNLDIPPIELVRKTISSSAKLTINDVTLNTEKSLEADDRIADRSTKSGQESCIGKSVGNTTNNLCQFDASVPPEKNRDLDSELSRGHHETTLPLIQQDSPLESQVRALTFCDPTKTAQVAKEVQVSVDKKVEIFVKEHIKPLLKSGVVTVEQYRWALKKTMAKVLHYHPDATSADFLITEGSKVKRLAEQYLQIFLQRHTKH